MKSRKPSLGNEHVRGTEVVLLAASFAIKGFQKSTTASFSGVLALLKKKKTKKLKKKRKVPWMTPLFLLERELGKVAYKQLAGRHQLSSSDREQS